MADKTYNELRNEMHSLNEMRILRAGAALFYAAKVRESGNRLVSKLGEAKANFRRAKAQKEMTAQIVSFTEGMESMADAMVEQRKMLGNMTGIALTTALLAERSNKDIIKLGKGNKRR